MPEKSARPRAADQPQQHGLRLIVASMAQGDAVGAERRTSTLEEFVARDASRVLERSALARRPRPHIVAIHEKRDVQSRGEIADECFVGVGRGAKLMVEMDDPGKSRGAEPLEFREYQRQRH
jgi:hypothetical protein